MKGNTSGTASLVKNIDGKVLPPRSILKNNNSDKHVEEQNMVNGNLTDNKSNSSSAATDDDKHAAATKGNDFGLDNLSYADKLTANKVKVNFRVLECKEEKTGVDVVLTRESVRNIHDKYANTIYGYFLGQRETFPVVDCYVATQWKKFGVQKTKMNANGFFFFKFADRKGMLAVLEGGPWVIRSKPIFLNVWSPMAKLVKEDIRKVVVWVKIHDVPIAAYTDDGLSMIATKLGSPKLLETYTSNMCTDAWGRSSYARALIEISAD